MSNTDNSTDSPVQAAQNVEQGESGNTHVAINQSEQQQTVQPQIAPQQTVQPQAAPQQVTQPQDVVQPVVQQQIPPVKTKKKFGLFELFIGAAVVFGGGYSAMNYFDISPSSIFSGGSSGYKGGTVLVINTDILISAVSVELMYDPNAKAKSTVLMQQIYKEIQSFTDKGYVVLDSDTPILHAPKSDITLEVAERLGVDAKKGYQIAKDNKFIGNAGSATLDLKMNESQNPKADSEVEAKHEDFSNLDLSTNKNGETMDLDY